MNFALQRCKSEQVEIFAVELLSDEETFGSPSSSSPKEVKIMEGMASSSGMYINNENKEMRFVTANKISQKQSRYCGLSSISPSFGKSEADNRDSLSGEQICVISPESLVSEKDSPLIAQSTIRKERKQFVVEEDSNADVQAELSFNTAFAHQVRPLKANT